MMLRMPRPLALWIAMAPLLALAACGSLFGSGDAPPESARARSCEQAADNDPDVYNLLQNHGGSANLNSFSDEYKAARAKALAKCETTVGGGTRRGGVEPLR